MPSQIKIELRRRGARVGPVIFRFKKSNFPFQQSEIPFRFRFIIAQVEFDEITIYREKTMKLSLVFQ